MLDLEKHKHIFFIGIGGISMSSLAEILNSKSINVSGSNNVENQMTEYLKEKGISVVIRQSEENITSDIDLVVYTAAISDDNPELIKAKELGIDIVRREILLSDIMSLYKFPIAISGTHGKTTTSSMLAEVFIKAKVNPTVSVGGIIKSINSNTYCGDDKYFIAEACEYKDSFLALNPYISVILNIDADHLDYFKGIEDIRASFMEFAKKVPDEGTLIINNNIINVSEFTSTLKCHVVTYGNMTAMVKADNIVYSADGFATFDVVYNGEVMTTITLKVPGYHNVSNALAAFATSYVLGISSDSIKEGIESFVGTERRMELKGEFNGIKVYDDYAHHPTEIKASISSFKAMPKNKLHVVFQSHTYTRTKALLSEFATSLADADDIIITDIYAARETNDVDVHPEDLVELIKEINPNVTYISKFEEIAKTLKTKCVKNDIIAIMGAGDVNKICSMLLK